MQEMLAAFPAAKVQKSIEKQRKSRKVAIERIRHPHPNTGTYPPHPQHGYPPVLGWFVLGWA